MQSGSLVRWRSPVAGNEAVIAGIRIYLDPNNDFRLSDTEDADRIIVADGSSDHRLAVSGIEAARLFRQGTNIYRYAI
jgi:hypothetical protein